MSFLFLILNINSSLQLALLVARCVSYWSRSSDMRATVSRISYKTDVENQKCYKSLL